MNIIATFELLSHRWHVERAKQKRKYTGEDYDAHTKAVAKLYQEYFPLDTIGAAAGHGHDLLEDCKAFGLTRYKLEDEAFDLKSNKPYLVQFVTGIIVEVTNIYTHKEFPHMVRPERAQMEAQRLSHVSVAAQNLKICDVLDNVKDIVAYDPHFALVYVREKRHLLDVMTNADERLRARAYSVLKENFGTLGLTWQEPRL